MSRNSSHQQHERLDTSSIAVSPPCRLLGPLCPARGKRCASRLAPSDVFRLVQGAGAHSPRARHAPRPTRRLAPAYRARIRKTTDLRPVPNLPRTNAPLVKHRGPASRILALGRWLGVLRESRKGSCKGTVNLSRSGSVGITPRQQSDLGIYCQPMLQISAQTWNVWVLQALCSAAVT